ncbi:MAG: hypothetical protein WD079_06270, partial [Phycisphaeraceae bacterium]
MQSNLRTNSTLDRPRHRRKPAVAAPTPHAEADLGICQWFHYHDYETVECAVGYLRELGIRHLRTGVSWADFYRPRGPQWYDWVFQQLEEFELLISVWHTPPSIGEAPLCTAPPQRLDEYTDVIGRIIERYGHAFEHLELWNEPNNLYKWDFRRFDPHWRKFARMIAPAAAYAQQHGKVTVLGGMSPIDPAWVALMQQHGALDAIDVVAMHSFPHMWWDDAPCWDQPDDWRGWADKVRRVAPVVGNRRLWISESGLATWDLRRSCRSRHALQVRMLDQAAAAPVERVYWYSLIDLDPAREAIEGFHVDENEYHLGLVRHDGTRKDAYWRMQQLLRDRRRQRSRGDSSSLGVNEMVASNESRKTTDHDEIRKWVESRKGRPARVLGTGGVDDPGLLRIDMPDEPTGEENLEPITWDD